MREVIGKCASCGGPVNDTKWPLYDEHREQYFCDRQCFEDWADNHFEEVVEYYARLNLK